MELLIETDQYKRYHDDIQVRTVFKDGSCITTLKHQASWHETAPEWCENVPCDFCLKQT